MQTRGQGLTMEYITRTFVTEPDYIAAARKEGERRNPGMQLSPYEGHLLQWLVRISGASNILEIGTFMGVSTLWMAGGITAPEGRITSLEFSADHAAQARTHAAASPYAEVIEIVQCDAHQWLVDNNDNKLYDLVFIDAEKKGYADYLEVVLPKLKPRGWIVGDNSLLFGALSGEHPDASNAASIAAMKKFNETLADPTRFESVLIPTIEGLTVARRR